MLISQNLRSGHEFGQLTIGESPWKVATSVAVTWRRNTLTMPCVRRQHVLTPPIPDDIIVATSSNNPLEDVTGHFAGGFRLITGNKGVLRGR